MSTQSSPLRIALIGTGSRAMTFLNAILARPSTVSVVAILEPNSVRAAFYNRHLQAKGQRAVPVYTTPGQFDQMCEKERVGCVVVTCVDAAHDTYVVGGLRRGLRVITEKPMTTTIEKCRAINRAARESPGGIDSLTVTFNYRYNPVHEKVKRILAAGEIGEILSLHFEWLLDTAHGADYFRRWHRQRANSGGLTVHKSGHHFDLVNWWLGSENGCEPTEVAAMGRLAFYGDAAGRRAGLAKRDARGEVYERARECDDATLAGDPFSLNLEGDETLNALYVEAEGEDGYFRDRNVFAPGIDIEDDMSILVRYSTGATMTYHLTAYSPWEGYRVMFNGSLGRLELQVIETAFRLPSNPNITGNLAVHGTSGAPNAGGATITLHKLWQTPVDVPIPAEYSQQGHGGGDLRMLGVLFGPRDGEGENADGGDAAKQKAGVRDGTMALAVGLAANESFRTGKFVRIKELNLDGLLDD